jgi:WD40 repeat protein
MMELLATDDGMKLQDSEPVSVKRTVEGHPREFVNGLLHLCLRYLENSVAGPSRAVDNDIERAADCLKRERSLGLFVMVNLVSLWQPNVHLISGDQWFPRNMTEILDLLVREIQNISAAYCEEDSCQGFSRKLSFVCGCILLFAQLIARCCPALIAIDSPKLLFADGIFHLPENPWNIRDLKNFGCRWVPENIPLAKLNRTGDGRSLQGTMIDFTVLLKLLSLCDMLEDSVLLFCRRSELFNRDAAECFSEGNLFQPTVVELTTCQCELLYACGRLKCCNLEPSVLEAVASASRNLVRKFTQSEVARVLLAHNGLLLSKPIGGLLLRRGQLLLSLNTKLQDGGFTRSAPYSGIEPEDVAAYLKWLYDFCSLQDELNHRNLVNCTRFTVGSSDKPYFSLDPSVSSLSPAILFRNMCVSCEYPQEFRLSKCSVDFWPWRGQKLSPELGSYAEDISIEDGDDVMQEMKIDEFIGRRYRMCCVSIGGFGPKSVSDDFLLTARALVMQSTGASSLLSQVIDTLLTSVLTLPKVSRELLQSRISFLMRCTACYLGDRVSQTSVTVCPDFQLHVVGVLHKILLQFPKETIVACRNSDIWLQLLGPLYFSGGQHEVGLIFSDSVFTEERVRRSSKVVMKVWTVRPGKDDLVAAWRGVCAYGWVSLKDAILDFACDAVQFSYSLQIGTVNQEIMLMLSVLKTPSHPSTANLAVAYQTTRWLRHVVHPEFRAIDRSEKYRLGKQFLVDIMSVVSMHLEIVGLAKLQTINMGSVTRQSMKMIWPARSSVVDFLLSLSSVEFFPKNLDWITLFLEKSSRLAGTENAGSDFFDADIGQAESAVTATSVGVTSSRARLKTLESLLLDPRCRAASMRILSRLISVYAVEMTMANDDLTSGAVPGTDMPDSGSSHSNLKAYTFDVVGRIMSVINFTVTHPTSVDSYNCALLCLRTLTWMLRAKKFLLLRQSIQYIFRNSDCMNTTLQSIIGILRPNDVKRSVLESSERWLLGSIVKQGLAFLTCIMANNDANRAHFSKLMLFNSSSLTFSRPGALGQQTTIETNDVSPTIKRKKMPAVSFEHFVTLLVETEGSISVEVVIVLFDMLLEAPCIRNRSMLSDPSILTDGMFGNDDDRPKIRNPGIIIMILSLVSSCSYSVQRFIMKTFDNLVRGRASLANLTICSQSKPSLLDLSIDLFPLLPPSNLGTLVRLVQCLGRHSISVAQLKHVFRILQGDGVSSPNYNHCVLQSLQGMISSDSAPFHTFVFEGDDSGLRLPPIFQWPTRSGFSFCVWFQVESPKTTRSDRHDVSDCGDDEYSGGLLLYEPYIISLRSSTNGPTGSANGAGIEIYLKPIGPGQFRPIMKLFPSSSGNEACTVEADCIIREGEWNFLAASVPGATDWADWARLRTNAGIRFIVNTSCKKHPLAFPFFIQDPVFAPIVGSTSTAAMVKELKKAQTSFRGQMGAIYMFSEAITSTKLISIQELGPSYQYNFESFTADYKDTFLPSKGTSASVQLSSNALSVLDGSLTHAIMLSYNPAVWSNELVLDNTPGKNGIRWHVGSYGSFVLEQGITFDDKGYYKMNARARKGTYHTKSQDIRLALDSLGGIKAVLPIFSQFDRIGGPVGFHNIDDSSAAEKPVSYWLFSLLSTLVQDAAARRRDVKSLTVLSYLIESVSSSHLTVEVFKILRVIYDNLSWNVGAQDNFMESIFANFKLWRNCAVAVQLELFKFLHDAVRDEHLRFRDFISVQRLIDTLQSNYDYVMSRRPSADISLHEIGNLSDAEMFAADPLLSQLTNRKATALIDVAFTADDLREVRQEVLRLVHLLFTKVGTFNKEDVPTLVSYACNSKCPFGQQEILQLLLHLLMDSTVNAKVLLGLGIGSCLALLASLTKSANASVRLYATLVVCKSFVICANSLPRQSSSAQAAGVASPGDRTGSSGLDDMNSSFISDIKSSGTSATPTSSHSVGVFMEESGNSSDLNANSTAFEDIGVPPSTLSGYVTLIQSQLLTATINNPANIAMESQVIVVLFQMTMLGIGSHYDEITSAIHWLDKCSVKIPFVPRRTDNSDDVENDITCKFKIVDGLASLDFQLTSDVSICIPMMLTPLMRFIREDIIDSNLRCNVLINLRACLSASDNNFDTVLHLPFWQSSVLEILASESKRQQELTAAGTINELGISSGPVSKLLTKAAASCEVCLRLLCELQVAAIRIGKPLGPPIIRRKHESVAPLDVIDSLKKIGKGDRNLGVVALRETMSCLRIFGGADSHLNVQDIGFMLLHQTLSALKREQDMLEQKRETTKDAYIDKLFNINIWLVVSVVLEFITCPMKRIVLLDDAQRCGSSELKADGSLPPASPPTAVCTSGPRSDIGAPIEETQRALSTEARSKSSTGCFLSDSKVPLFNTYAVPLRGSDGQDFRDNLVEEYSLTVDNVLQLINLIFELLAKFMKSGAVPYEDRMFLITATSDIGVITGTKLLSRIIDTVDNIVTVPRNPSESKIVPKTSAVGMLKKTPLMYATGGVSWIMIRVVCSIICRRGFISGRNDSVGGSGDNSSYNSGSSSRLCVTPLMLVQKLQSWVAACETNDVDFTYFELFNLCVRLIEALRHEAPTYSSPTSTQCLRTVVEFVVRLTIKYRNSFYEVMDSLSEQQDTSVSSRTLSTSSNFGGGGLVSRLMASLPGGSFSTQPAEDDSVPIRTHNQCDTSAPFISDPSLSLTSAASTPYKSMRSTTNFGLAVNTDAVIHECMAVFDKTVALESTVNINVEASSATRFSDVLLRIVNIAVNNVPGFDGMTNILRWDSWERIYALVSLQAQSMVDESLHSKLCNKGAHQHISVTCDEFDDSQNEFSKLVNDWNILSEQSVDRAAGQHKLHLADKLRVEEFCRRKLASRWNTILSELANERGPWGYSTHNEVFWMLDPRENVRRQRPRLKRNMFGNRHHAASMRRLGRKASNACEITDSPREHQEAGAQDIWKDLMKYKRTTSTSTTGDDKVAAAKVTNSNVDEMSDEEDEPSSTFSDGRTIASWDSENTVMFSANIDVITIVSNSTGGRSSGTLEVTRSKMTFTRSSDQEPVDSNNQEFTWITQSIPNTTWQMSDVHWLFQRMYLLQFTAIEIIFTNRTTVFLNLFSENQAKKLYRCIQHKVRPPFLQVLGHRNPERAVRTALLAGGSHAVLTHAWMQRQVSNFDYLMSLNTLAGRTFNDLGQYPVFPWIIADYVSSKLDLRNPDVYRDLRYSVGAQSDQQRRQCMQRYKDASEMYESNPSMEFPPFHHGTHYSCMGFIFWYLVRLEPFTSLHVWLQDGKFDHPDRLFASIADTWAGTTTNHNDVKELIPEFFYLPEFLENVNELDLGTSQSGVRVGDVKLPPWCSNSLEFVRLNREALESEYVSANLHHWIDLIFGYKQRPPMFKGHSAAVDDCNVFFHLTYSDAVNLEEMKVRDTELYERTIRQIDNYGQTPNRLFDKPHPQRRPLNKVKVIWPIASIILGVDTISNKEDMPEMPKRIMCFNEEKVTNFPVLYIVEIRSHKRLLTVDASRMIGYHQFVVKQPDVVPPYTFKVDGAALKVSLGQQTQDNWFVFSTKIQREFFVGVPFSSLELTTKTRRLLFTAQTQGVSLVGKDDNKQAMIKRETERARGKSISLLNVSSEAHIVVPGSSGAVSARSSKSRDEIRRSTREGSPVAANTGSTSGKPSNLLSRNVVAPLSGSSVQPHQPTQPTKEDGFHRNKRSKTDHQLYNNLYPHLFAVVPDTRLLFSCGHWDNSFKVTLVDSGKLVQSVIAHSDVVTCLATASDFSQHWLVTGSRDCTVMVWDIFPDRVQPVSANPMVLYGHDDTVTCIAVCAELDIVASGSDDGTITVYSLREGTYIRSIMLSKAPDRSMMASPRPRLPSGSSKSAMNLASFSTDSGSGLGTPSSGTPLITSKIEVQMICVSRESYLVVYASDSAKYLLYSYTINGRFVEKIELPERLSCMIMSEDSRVLLTGGERCLVVMRWVHNLQLAKDGPRTGQEAVLDGKEGDQGPFSSSIRSLYLTHKERHLVVGLESGDIRILAQVG